MIANKTIAYDQLHMIANKKKQLHMIANKKKFFFNCLIEV